MNLTTSFVRRATVLSGCFLLSLVAAAAESATAAADRASQLLVQTGSVSVRQAGPYVETGTFRVQVAAKLGRPDAMLPDGTWLYHGRQVANSGAAGTLVVRFAGGRVSSLALVTPAVATAMLEGRPANARPLIATK